jgi:hypothetical protein
MCKETYTLHLHSADAVAEGVGILRFDRMDLTHWPNVKQWKIQNKSFVLFNQGPVIAHAAIDVILEGLGANHSSSHRTPILTATRDVNNIYTSTSGPCLYGTLNARSLRLFVRRSDTRVLEACGNFTLSLECVPFDEN